MVRVRILFILNIHSSSFTLATNARNDGVSVIRLTYSTFLVHNVSDLRTSDFQGCNPWSECEFCSFSINLNIHSCAFTLATNARNDGVSVIRLTYYTLRSWCIMFRI